MNYLICNPDSVPSLVNVAKVFTTNWHVVQACETRGIQAIQLEDALTLDATNRIDEFVYGILYTWFQHEGIDFTQFEGVSLGLAHADEVYHGNLYPTDAFTTTRGIAPFIKSLVLFQQLFQNNPEAITHDLEPCSACDALELLAVNKQVKLISISTGVNVVTPATSTTTSPIQRVKQLVKPLYQWLKSQSKSTPRNRIAIIPYSCFDKLRVELNNHNIGTIELNPGDLPTLSSVSIRPIHDAWNRVQAAPAYRQRFHFDGIDCHEWFINYFAQIVQTKFPQSIPTILGIQRFLTKQKVFGLVVPFDSPNFASLCVQTANHLKIPTLDVQHGVFASSYSGNWEFRSARHLAVINHFDRVYTERRNPTAQITEIGCIQTDRYCQISNNNYEPPGLSRRSVSSETTSGINPEARGDVVKGPLRLLVLTYAPSSGTSACKASGSEQYMLDIVAALSQIPQMLDIAFKLHPSEKVKRYQRILAKNPLSHTHRIESGWNLPQLLSECDLVIAPVSTGIVEAVAMGKPAILFHPMLEPIPLAYAPEHGLPVAEIVEELVVILQSVVLDVDTYYQRYPFERFLSQFRPGEGAVFERVARIVEQWIPEGQR